MHAPDLHEKMHHLEREIDRIKSHFALGKLSLEFSKNHVRELEHDLALLIEKLPPHEREIYLLRKEFGKEF